jgi:hypothetical protein
MRVANVLAANIGGADAGGGDVTIVYGANTVI